MIPRGDCVIILFANGGWISFDPIKKQLVEAGEYWSDNLDTILASYGDSIFVAVPKSQLDELNGVLKQ